MDTLTAFAMGEANRGKERMVFDWDQAAKLMKQYGCREAGAGLQGDLEWTAGDILQNGKPTRNDYTYLASTWATPVLLIDDQEIPCYVMESQTEWNCNTKWPQSAMDILGFTENDFYREEETEVPE